ncbi:CBS domain-containing protein [Halorientalis pallida]|uniref:CBS domain-containing protein n=1 Tax=Halorientalis pallida TaxID=2479928 RepID=A0A498KX82_9EURY|nr:CBS domain-containing protein [Halorientalis pallida]RXK50230.1 CBS domain-containing protein [Halorientalis pallida]
MLVPVTIREVMNPTVETIGPDLDAAAVAELLHGRDIGSVVVVESGDPVGIVTESDVVGLVAEGYDADAVTAADCMSAPVVTVDADDPIETAVELFREHTIKKLPVTDDSEARSASDSRTQSGDGDLVGIVTTTDLSHYLPHLTRETAASGGSTADHHHRERVDTAYERDEWDFESLGPHDDRIETGDVVKFTKTLSQEDIESFAEASGDTNRLHLDADYAEGTRFGRPIAHGTLVVGVVSAALARLPGLIVYLSQDTSFLGPVDIGSEVTAECEVVEDLGNGRYRLTTRAHTDGDEVVDGEAVVIADPIPDTA